MSRRAPWVLLALCALLAPATIARAADLRERWGLGTQLGWQKLTGGERDYSNVDQSLTLWLRRGVGHAWTLEGGLHYGWVRPGALLGEDAGLSTGSVHAFYTTTLHGMVGARRHFGPGRTIVPYLGLYAGCLDWRVRDENGVEGVGALPDGPVVDGYDTAGARHPLRGRPLTGTVEAGLECFVGASSSLAFGARYTRLFGGDLDNVGSGNLWGPGEVDVNDGLAEAYAGLCVYWGGDDDLDDDGVPNRLDAALTVPVVPLMVGGSSIKGITEGDSDPKLTIPALIELNKAGKFPFEKLITLYPLEKINEAIDDQYAGRCVKAVLTM